MYIHPLFLHKSHLITAGHEISWHQERHEHCSSYRLVFTSIISSWNMVDHSIWLDTGIIFRGKWYNVPLLLCYVIKDRASLLNAAAIEGSKRDTHVELRSNNCGFHELYDHHWQWFNWIYFISANLSSSTTKNQTRIYGINISKC